MICSKIQMDSLSNTVVLFIDCESAVRAMTRLPPWTGAPPVPDDVDVPDDPPQAARTMRPPTAIRARTVVVRYVTVAPCGSAAAVSRGGGRGTGDKPAQTLFLAQIQARERVGKRAGSRGTVCLALCTPAAPGPAGAWAGGLWGAPPRGAGAGAPAFSGPGPRSPPSSPRPPPGNCGSKAGGRPSPYRAPP